MGKGRAPCCDKSKVKKGPWSPGEDLRLITFIQKHGHGNWRSLPKQAGLLRCGKSCRLRWINYLRPDVKRGNFTKEEEEIIIKLHKSLGNRWSKIASCLPGRTDNEIKNVWNTHLKKTMDKKDANFHKVETENSSSTTQDSLKITHEEPKEASSSSSSSTSSSASNYSKSTRQVDDVSKIWANEEANYNNISVNSDQVIELPLPLESDVDDFWEMLENLDSFQSNESQLLPRELEASQSSNCGEEYDNMEIECEKWMKYLENELGLDAIIQ